MRTKGAFPSPLGYISTGLLTFPFLGSVAGRGTVGTMRLMMLLLLELAELPWGNLCPCHERGGCRLVPRGGTQGSNIGSSRQGGGGADRTLVSHDSHEAAGTWGEPHQAGLGRLRGGRNLRAREEGGKTYAAGPTHKASLTSAMRLEPKWLRTYIQIYIRHRAPEARSGVLEGSELVFWSADLLVWSSGLLICLSSGLLLIIRADPPRRPTNSCMHRYPEQRKR